MALELRGCVVDGWREPVRSDDDKRLNFCGKCEMRAPAEASASRSFERGSAFGCTCPLGRRCDALLPSLEAMVNNGRWYSLSAGRPRAATARNVAVGLWWRQSEARTGSRAVPLASPLYSSLNAQGSRLFTRGMMLV